jgi:hypothetical protein
MLYKEIHSYILKCESLLEIVGYSIEKVMEAKENSVHLIFTQDKLVRVRLRNSCRL